MNPISRRSMLGTAAAGSLLTASTAIAQESRQTAPVPQPQEPGRGGSDSGPRNPVLDRLNPDMLTPPSTDHGTLPNLKFSFSEAHMRLEKGGWTRQGP